MSEYIELGDFVRFSVYTYHPSSGQSTDADSTPRWFVYDSGIVPILDGSMQAKTGLVGAYIGSFQASVSNGFASDKYYSVEVSGSIDNQTAFTTVKDFVVDDLYNVNVVQVSGEYVDIGDFGGGSSLTEQQVYNQASGALIDYDPPTKSELDSGLAGLNDLDAVGVRTAVGLSAADLDDQLGVHLGNLTSISGDVTGLDGEAMRGTDDAALAATALTNATWTDTRAGYLDTIPNLSTSTNLEAVSGVLVARTIVSADYFDPAADTVAQVTLVDTVTDVTNIVNANMVQVSGSQTTLRNFGYTYDGTGYSDIYAPAQQQQLSNIANVGSAINAEVSAFVKSAAEPETNDYTETVQADGVYHIVEDDTGTTDFYYEFEIGSDGVPTSFTWTGYTDGTGDDYLIYAYNFVTSSYDQIGTVTDTFFITTRTESWELTTSHVGTGVNEGKVRMRVYSTAGTAFATDRVLCSYAVVNRSVGYADGAIWVDTNGGTAGTTSFINGTADNPVNSWADALSLHTALGIHRFRIIGGSTIQLSSDSTSYELIGDGLWTLQMNGQTVTNSYIKNAIVTGTGNGTGVIMEDCSIQNSASVPAGYYVRCGIAAAAGTPMTGSTAGEYAFVDCVSVIPGSATPYMDFTSLGSSSGVNFRRWSGGSNITIDSNNTLSMEVVGGGGQTVTTDGGNVEIRGTCRSVTVSVTGSETVQFVGVTGPVTINDDGASTATINLYGVASAVTDNTTGSTVNDYTVKGPTTDAILVDTNELQTNQGNWLTATGFATLNDVLSASGAITDQISGLNNFDPAVDTVAQVTLVDTVTDVTNIIDANIIQVSGEYVDIGNFKTDISSVSTLTETQVYNQASGAIVDYDGPTKSELDSGLAGLNDLDAAGIRSAVGLSSANLDTQLTAIDNYVDTMEADLKTYGDSNWTTATGFPSSGDIADSVWGYAIHIDNHWLAPTYPAKQWMVWASGDLLSSNKITNLTNEITAISGDVAGLNGEAMRGTDNASTFDHTSDTVAHVTLVDTTTNVTNNVDANIVQVSGENVSIDDFKYQDTSIYFANIKYVYDGTNGRDEYAVQWYQDDQPVTSGDIIDPAISVYNTSDGSAILQHQLLTYASPLLGVLRHNEPSSLLASGEPYLVETSGTINSSLRTWKTVVGIDVF